MTITELKILAVLLDGKPHTKEELRGCLADELSDNSVLRVHMCNLRRKLVERSRTVVFVNGAYRLFNTS